MAHSATSDRKTVLLPQSVTAAIRGRLTEATGLLIMVGSGWLMLSLLSWNSADPSWNNAGATEVAGLGGLWGAYVADLLMQTIGIAAVLLPTAIAAWGFEIVRQHHMARLWRRLSLLPFALLIGAGFAATLTVPAVWPIAAGLGGALGDLGISGLNRFGAYFAVDVPIWLFTLLLFVTAIALSYLAIGIRLADVSRAVQLSRTAAQRTGAFLRRPADWINETRVVLTRLRSPRKDTNPIERVEPVLDVSTFDEEDGSADFEEAAQPRRVARSTKRTKESRRAKQDRQPRLAIDPDGEYVLPTLELLSVQGSAERVIRVSDDALEQNARLLESVLGDFGIKGEILHVRPGPVVTLYELEPAPGIKSSRVIGLADDIARSMSAVSARVAVIPGRNVIGIELPNAQREIVSLRQLLSTTDYEGSGAELALALGKDISGAPVVVDLARMPHLLIAGTTGSGKSVALNTMILSLLYRLTPDQCRMIMVDPKMLELSVYDGIPHLLTPVVTDPHKAVVALKWAVREMEDRYKRLAQLGVRNLTGYNQRLAEARKKGEALTRTVQTGFDPDTGQPVFEEQPLDLEPLPLVVVVVDEMADLMMVAGKDIEAAIQRLAQMARAAGIHLIMATQRPSVDVITGTIKANFPTRISFQVTSKIDSRTILGEQGAEQLLGQGDMLYMAGGGRISRVHGPFVSDEEVEDVVRHLKAQGVPDYLEEVTEISDADAPFPFGSAPTGDDLYDQAVALVAREGKASTSFVQRHLQIGYNRAARIIEEMEAQGVIGPANHVGKREILVSDYS